LTQPRIRTLGDSKLEGATMPSHRDNTSAAATAPHLPPPDSVSLFHLYGLRIVFFLIALFLLSSTGPLLAAPPPTMMTGAARALFVALGLMAALGIRYPLQMLPIMLFEIAWKALWLAFVGFPLWAGGRLDPANSETFFSIAVGLPLALVVVPWRYAFRNYVRRPGERWRPEARSSR
jgi:hypothetical protein